MKSFSTSHINNHSRNLQKAKKRPKAQSFKQKNDVHTTALFPPDPMLLLAPAATSLCAGGKTYRAKRNRHEETRL